MKQLHSVIEQISASGGNFIFFLVVARLSGPEEFGVFAAYLIAAQIIHNVAIQWVILPITSSASSSDFTLLLSCWRRTIVLFIWAPLFFGLYAVSILPDATVPWFVLNVSLIAMGLISADILRFFFIRIDWSLIQIVVNLMRWILAFTVFFLAPTFDFSRSISAVAAMVIGFLPSVIFHLLLLVRLKRSRFILDESATKMETSDRENTYFKTLLLLGIANSVYTIVTTYALALVSMAALGAFQAFRSLVNWAPLILQFLETHFAASLVREGRLKFLDRNWAIVFITFLIGGMLIFTIFGVSIISFTVGEKFIDYHWVLVAMFLMVMIQSATRVMSIEARLSGAESVMASQKNILIAASIGLVTYVLVYKPNISFAFLLTSMIIVALYQSGSIIFMLQRHKKHINIL